jgi:hypothetical protein
MTLGDILTQVAEKDLSGGKKLSPLYEEKVDDGKFKIRLLSETDPDAYIHCSIPYDVCLSYEELEGKKNYLRSYFLSMVFNAAIHGVKRKKQNNKTKPSN